MVLYELPCHRVTSRLLYSCLTNRFRNSITKSYSCVIADIGAHHRVSANDLTSRILHSHIMSEYESKSFGGYLNGKPLDLTNLHSVPPPPIHGKRKPVVGGVPVGTARGNGPLSPVAPPSTTQIPPVPHLPTDISNNYNNNSLKAQAPNDHNGHPPNGPGQPRVSSRPGTPGSLDNFNSFYFEDRHSKGRQHNYIASPASSSAVSVDRTSISTSEFYDSRSTPSPGPQPQESNSSNKQYHNDNSRTAPRHLHFPNDNRDSNPIKPAHMYSEVQKMVEAIGTQTTSLPYARATLTQNTPTEETKYEAKNPYAKPLEIYHAEGQQIQEVKHQSDTVRTTGGHASNGYATAVRTNVQKNVQNSLQTAAAPTPAHILQPPNLQPSVQGVHVQGVSMPTIPTPPNDIRASLRHDIRADIRMDMMRPEVRDGAPTARHSVPALLRMPSPFKRYPAAPLSSGAAPSAFDANRRTSPYGPTKFSQSSPQVQMTDESQYSSHRRSGSVNSSSSGLSSSQPLYMNASGPQSASQFKQQIQGQGSYFTPSQSINNDSHRRGSISSHVSKLSDTAASPAELGIGVGSAYVKELRKRAAVTWCDVPPKVWGLPIGIAGKAATSTATSAFNPSRMYLRRAMDIKHSHLAPRLLASEVDEEDDDTTTATGASSGTSSNQKKSIGSELRVSEASSKASSVTASAVPSVAASVPRTPVDSVSIENEQSSTDGSNRPRANSESSIKSVEEDVGKIRLFVANPDED